METIEWQCPYCDHTYKTEREAENCAEDCVLLNVESPKKVVFCCCEVCGKSYRKQKSAAARCEKEHKERGDNAWLVFQDKQARELLKAAANHASQKRLEAYEWY
jgi:hypothetical protein